MGEWSFVLDSGSEVRAKRRNKRNRGRQAKLRGRKVQEHDSCINWELTKQVWWGGGSWGCKGTHTKKKLGVCARDKRPLLPAPCLAASGRWGGERIEGHTRQWGLCGHLSDTDGEAADPERSESEKRGMWVSGSEILNRGQTGNVKDVKLSLCSVFGSSEKSPSRGQWC